MFWTCEIFTLKQWLFLCHDATVRDFGDGTCTVLGEGFFQIFGTANLHKKKQKWINKGHYHLVF